MSSPPLITFAPILRQKLNGHRLALKSSPRFFRWSVSDDRIEQCFKRAASYLAAYLRCVSDEL